MNNSTYCILQYVKLRIAYCILEERKFSLLINKDIYTIRVILYSIKIGE